jgi:hypothetical protein
MPCTGCTAVVHTKGTEFLFLCEPHNAAYVLHRDSMRHENGF